MERRMNQVSTNLTLFYRLFIPIFFGVFLGAFVIFLWTHPQAYYSNLKGIYLRYGMTAFYITMMVLLLASVWRLRRVEVSEDWLYVTDYFRSARYPWSNVEKLRETRIGIFTIVNVYLHAPGTFGKRVTFLASVSRWRIYKEEFPGQLNLITT